MDPIHVSRKIKLWVASQRRRRNADKVTILRMSLVSDLLFVHGCLRYVCKVSIKMNEPVYVFYFCTFGQILSPLTFHTVRAEVLLF